MPTASVLATVIAFLTHLYKSISRSPLANPKGSMYSSNLVSIVFVIQSNELLGANALCMPLEMSYNSPHWPFSPSMLSSMMAFASSPALKTLGDIKDTKGLKLRALAFFCTAAIKSGELTT